MQRERRILIIGWFTFPFGSATASRVRTLAKGLNEHGLEVFVITTARIPLRSSDQTRTGELSWMDIRYETHNCYEENDKVKPSLARRTWNYIKATCKSWIRIHQMLRGKHFSGIMICGNVSMISHLPVVILAWLNKVAIFYDIVEWFPVSKFKGGFINPRFYDDWLGRHLPLLFSRGVISISSYIFNKYTRYQIPCLLVPSVFDSSLDFTRHSVSQKSRFEHTEFILIYAGTCKDGDGFEILLEAVKIAILNSCPARLNVLGTDGLSGSALEQRKICEQDEILCSCVNFLGRVSDEEYFSAISSADCLVLPRPNCQIARAAFPTRLPEFLATGIPVLTTNIPDIPKYLDAGVHAEIVPEDTPNALASGILKLWQEPDRARKIGLAGQERGLQAFDYRQHTLKLCQFILDKIGYLD